MALKITEDCINCDVCEPVCPNVAIYQSDHYEINPDLCTECVGHFETPQCQLVCPVACIVSDPNFLETPENLFIKSQQLMVARKD